MAKSAKPPAKSEWHPHFIAEASNILSRARIFDGKHVPYSEFFKPIKEKKIERFIPNEKKDEMRESLGAQYLYNIFADVIFEYFLIERHADKTENKNEKETERKLTDYEASEIASRIAKKIDLIPIKYTIILPLPNTRSLLELITEPFNVSDRIIVTTIDIEMEKSEKLASAIDQYDDIFDKNYQSTSGLLSMMYNPQKIKTVLAGSICLKLKESGWINTSGFGPAVNDLERLIKRFFGMLFCQDVFTEYQSLPINKEIVRAYAFAESGSELKFHSVIEVSRSLSWLIANLNYEKTVRGYKFDRGNLLGGTPVQVNAFIDALDKNVLKITHSKYDDCKPFNAAGWYIDSLMNDHNALAIVELIICIEMLFGTRSNIKSDLAVTELLATRASCILGRKNKQRDEICKIVKKGYKIRSKIVHEGQWKLRDEDQEAYYSLRHIVKCAIWHETHELLNE